MKLIKKTIRRDSGLVENVCKHGVGHPAYGSVNWLKIHGIEGASIHGCDGCCRDKDWQIEDLKKGVEISNGLLQKAIKIGFGSHVKVINLEGNKR